jgi:hypothetical protein
VCNSTGSNHTERMELIGGSEREMEWGIFGEWSLLYATFSSDDTIQCFMRWKEGVEMIEAFALYVKLVLLGDWLFGDVMLLEKLCPYSRNDTITC